MSIAPLRLTEGQKVYIGGKFFSVKAKAIREALKAQGIGTVRSCRDADAIVLGARFTAGDVYAVKEGARVVFEHELGPALSIESHAPDERIAEWVERFSDGLRELIAHPNVRVALVDLAKPASDRQIASAEKKLGGELPATLDALYRTYGSWTVLWQFENSPLKEDTENLQQTIARLGSDFCVGQRYDGSLRILPLPKASKKAAEEVLWHGPNDQLASDLGAYLKKLGHEQPRLWLFDYFSEYAMAVVQVEPAPGSCTVLYGTAHGARLDGARPSDLQRYLDAVVAAHLSVEARKEMLDLPLSGDPTERFEGPFVEVDLDGPG